MEANWTPTTWGDTLSLEYGKSLRDYVSGPVRVFGTNGPVGWTDKPLAEGPGVILGRKGAYRGVHYSEQPFFVIDTAYYVKPKVETDMRWLFYAIKHYKLGEIDDGSPIPSTTRSAVYVRDLDLPPLIEQRAIARVLGTLDEKIALNRRMRATLEAIGRALFKSWFVDFDPVSAKAAGRDPGLPLAFAALFPDRFENKDGKIPAEWTLEGLDKIARYLNGLALQKYPPTGVDYLRVIKIAQLRAGHAKNADRASTNLPSDYIVDSGDVLFSWSGSLECVVWTGGRGALNQHLFKVTSTKHPK